MGINSYISIGNSDDRLTQSQWSAFVANMRTLLVVDWAGRLQIHGEWFANPDQPWQNANWCVEILPPAWWVRASAPAGRQGAASLAQATQARDAEMHETRLQLKDAIRTLCRHYSQDSFAWTSGTVELVPTGWMEERIREQENAVRLYQLTPEHGMRLLNEDETRTFMQDPNRKWGSLEQAIQEGWLPGPVPTRGEDTGSTTNPAPASTGEAER